MTDAELHKLLENAYNIGMFQHEDEIIPCVRFLQSKNIRSFLEIGTEKGGLFYLLYHALNKPLAISIDLPTPGFVDVDARNAMMRSWGDNIHIINKNSHDLDTNLYLFDILSKSKLDLLFIDGDHSQEGVISDFQMYSYLVADKGTIIFHDVTAAHRPGGGGPQIGVPMAWDEIKEGRPNVTFDRHHEWGGIGMLLDFTEKPW